MHFFESLKLFKLKKELCGSYLDKFRMKLSIGERCINKPEAYFVKLSSYKLVVCYGSTEHLDSPQAVKSAQHKPHSFMLGYS